MQPPARPGLSRTKPLTFDEELASSTDAGAMSRIAAREAHHAWLAASQGREALHRLEEIVGHPSNEGEGTPATGLCAAIEDLTHGQGQVIREFGAIRIAMTNIEQAIGSPGSQKTAPTGLHSWLYKIEARVGTVETRDTSHNEIVEGLGRLHIEEETTEIRARMAAVERRAAWTYWVKQSGKWLFVGGGAAILGALLERCW